MSQAHGIPTERISLTDQLHVGSLGLTGRKARAALSALGIAIGIASLVSVLGLSSSSKADLVAQLDRLGTNLLTVTAGQSMFGQESTLPATAPAMIGRVATVQGLTSVSDLSGLKVYRHDHVPEGQTGGLGVAVADRDLPATLGATLAHGRWLDMASSQLPTTVLGATAAARLGITSLQTPVRIWLGEQWFGVVGILEPLALAPELDATAFVGRPVAASLVKDELRPTTVYLRVDVNEVAATRDVLARTANPAHPDEVRVSRPSDALAAQLAATNSFTSLLLGLGAVALLVGAVGIANVMVISVLERRREIGLRRSLGASRGDIAVQFLTEALLLSLAGGIVGAVLGSGLTAAYALMRGWAVVIPPVAYAVGIGGAIVVGALAGLYPATRAARLSPTDALRSA